jgi:hypothetical protein
MSAANAESKPALLGIQFQKTCLRLFYPCSQVDKYLLHLYCLFSNRKSRINRTIQADMTSQGIAGFQRGGGIREYVSKLVTILEFTEIVPRRLNTCEQSYPR